MNTWSCKAPLAAFALTALAACEDGGAGSLLDSLTPERSDVALSQARMAFGAVDLVAPRGFCIDKRSLKQSFALMARCDRLGVPSAAADAPLGIITVSFAASIDGAALPTPDQTAAALELADISDPLEDDQSVTFRASGPPPALGTSDIHWRATTMIGGQIMGLALYGPAGGQAISGAGRAILADVIKGSSAGS